MGVDEEGDPHTEFGLGAEVQAKPLAADMATGVRVLVCAPSNSALDEIVARILSGGMLNG